VLSPIGKFHHEDHEEHEDKPFMSFMFFMVNPKSIAVLASFARTFPEEEGMARAMPARPAKKILPPCLRVRPSQLRISDCGLTALRSTPQVSDRHSGSLRPLENSSPFFAPSRLRAFA
jgi:hypothetical protein